MVEEEEATVAMAVAVDTGMVDMDREEEQAPTLRASPMAMDTLG
jgi:hypothetical protein